VRIAVTGSLAYDYIMNFPGYFTDHMLMEKAHVLSVSFLVDSMKRLRGGVAGNIAYTLALLGDQPLIVATVGQDFSEYNGWLARHGVDTSGLTVIDDEFTSSCFINTDQANNQIVAFYPGAMSQAREISLLDHQLTASDLVVISPTDPQAMERYVLECQQQGIPYLFDPGKQTPRLEREHLELGLKGARVLVSNDYEFAMMARKLEVTEQELIASVPLTVVTRGEQGALIYSEGALIDEIPVAPVHAVVDPTGAGDAFLGGLVYGLARELPLAVSGRIASLAASFCIEHRGCQEHSFSTSGFAKRYQQAFGSALPTGALASADVIH
jgi:adenosine kinase